MSAVTKAKTARVALLLATMACASESARNETVVDAGEADAAPLEAGRGREGCKVLFSSISVPISGVFATSPTSGRRGFSVFRDKLPDLYGPFMGGKISLELGWPKAAATGTLFDLVEKDPAARFDFLVPCTSAAVDCPAGEPFARYVSLEGSFGIRRVTTDWLHVEAWHLRLDRQPLEPRDRTPQPSSECLYIPWIALSGPLGDVSARCADPQLFDEKQACRAAGK